MLDIMIKIERVNYSEREETDIYFISEYARRVGERTVYLFF
jgi:hypothetical protein